MAKTKAPPLSPLASRVMRLVNEVGGGSQRRFAVLIGVSQAVISKIITGQAEPGMKVLFLASRLPNLNSSWLYTGEGDPFFDPRAMLDQHALRLNIAAQLLVPRLLSDEFKDPMPYATTSMLCRDALSLADLLIAQAKE